MHRLFTHKRFVAVWFKVKTESGASAIEYGLLAALIAVVIITAVTTVGSNLSGVFQSVSNVVHS